MTLTCLFQRSKFTGSVKHWTQKQSKHSPANKNHLLSQGREVDWHVLQLSEDSLKKKEEEYLVLKVLK